MNITFELNMWGMNEEEQKEYIISEMERRINGGSKYHFDIAIEMYNDFPFLKEIWDYNPNERLRKDRFKLLQLIQIKSQLPKKKFHQGKYQKSLIYVRFIL